MHLTRLALIAPLWIALSGAAPAPSPLDALSECRVPRAQVDGVLASVQVVSSRPAKEGKGTIFYYKIPEDLRAFGYAPHMLARNVPATPGGHMQVLTAVKGPFAEVEARMLAGHSLKTCPRRAAGGTANCVVDVELAGGGSVMMVLQDFGDNAIGINCAYLPGEE